MHQKTKIDGILTGYSETLQTKLVTRFRLKIRPVQGSQWDTIQGAQHFTGAEFGKHYTSVW